MGSPARRTWTLAGLDRSVRWLLWFDPAARRWEVQATTAGGAGPDGGPSPAPQRSAEPARVRPDPHRSPGTWPAPR